MILRDVRTRSAGLALVVAAMSWVTLARAHQLPLTIRSPESGHVKVAYNAGRLTDAEVARAHGSLKEALWRWWQSVQLRDVSAVLRASSPRAIEETGVGRLRRAIKAVAPSFGRPRLVESKRNGESATAYVVVLAYEARETTPAGGQPVAIRMTRAGGSWLIDDLGLVLSSWSAIQAL